MSENVPVFDALDDIEYLLCDLDLTTRVIKDLRDKYLADGFALTAEQVATADAAFRMATAELTRLHDHYEERRKAAWEAKHARNQS